MIVHVSGAHENLGSGETPMVCRAFCLLVVASGAVDLFSALILFWVRSLLPRVTIVRTYDVSVHFQ